jgi:Fic family protein
MSLARYQIKPDRNIPWNSLPSLPLDKELYQTVEILENLGNAKAALARLHGRSAVIPNQGLLINTISLQEAKTSSEIENIFTTDDELYRSFSEDEKVLTGSAKEVLRYREALWAGYNYLQNKGELDKNYFIKVFQEVKETEGEIRPGFLNTTIKQGNTEPNSGQVIYTPPKGKSVINKKLDNLIEFMNDDKKYPIDALLKMAMGHFQFEAIHAFRDGNGRVGRIFSINYLVHKGLLDVPILYLSRYILDHREDYYSGLMGVSQRGNWHNWLLFMLRAIENTANDTFHKINDIMETQSSILEFVSNDKRKFKSPDKLIELIFTQPFTKVNHLVKSGLYSENTARDYLNRLTKLQVLEKKTIHGHHYYLNIELYRILGE